MDSVTLKVSVDAVNVLVLIPLTVFRLDKCPDPSIWDQSVYKVDDSTDMRYVSSDLQVICWEVFTLTLALSHRGRGDTSTLTRGSSPGQALGSRLRGNDGGGARGITLTLALSHQGRGDAAPGTAPRGIPCGLFAVVWACIGRLGPLRFAKGTVSSEPLIALISQMGYDAPLPFVPGFWVPACVD